MRSNKIRSLAWALALCLSLCACAAPAESSGAAPAAPETTTPEVLSADSATQEFLASITPETAELKGVCGPSSVWYYQDNVLLIKGTGEMTTASWKDYDNNNRAFDQRLSNRVRWVILDEGVTTVVDRAFTHYDLVSAVIPSSVTEIGEYAFGSCSSLTDITLSGGITKIKDSAFAECNSLTKIFLPSSITEMGDDVFASYFYPENRNEIFYYATIHGEAGSYAETYANEHNIPFEAE